jgi:hypothetical protein
MNDVEHDLRELFERKASSVGGVAPKLPETVRKRSRRHQIGTALVGAFSAVAIVAVAIGALGVVGRGPDRLTPGGTISEDYEVFQRSATVGSFTITSGSDWFLVRPATDGRCDTDEGCEVLQLTNFDPGLDRSVCGEALPAGGVALIVRFAPDVPGDQVPEWPTTQEGPNTDGRCGDGRYFLFQDEGNSAPYEAWIARGPEASDQAVARLLRSFQDMTLESSGLMTTGDAAYVIAGGENAAGAWRLELTRSTSGGSSANVDLTVVSPEGGARAADFTVPHAAVIEQAGGDPVFGAVTKAAVGVEIRRNAMLPGPAATIVPLPPSLPFDFDLFFASHEGDEPPFAVPVGVNGDPLGNIAGISESDGAALFEILGTEGTIMTDRSTGITCYVVASEQGLVDGCAEEVTLQTIPLPEEQGQILVFSHVDAIRLSGIELDVDGGETITGSECRGPVCVMGIPAGSGSGTLWLLQEEQRADSAPIAWTPNGVERI